MGKNIFTAHFINYVLKVAWHDVCNIRLNNNKVCNKHETDSN